MDWKSLISDLKAAGLSETHIAGAVSCGQASINEIGSGKTTNPRYNLGRALVELHRRVCTKPKRSKALASHISN
jgi:hypothetical protein